MNKHSAKWPRFRRGTAIATAVCMALTASCGSDQDVASTSDATTTSGVDTSSTASSTTTIVWVAPTTAQPNTADTVPTTPPAAVPDEPVPTDPPVTTPEPVPTNPPIDPPEPVPINPPEGWELVWNDEFEGDTIDLSNWTYDIGGWGWGNGEAQYYTSRPQNARIENGLLVIEAHQERYENSYYTSARLKTLGLREFQYGRFEARIKVPAGAGLWPAFWMLGAHFDRHSEDEANHWPFVGEIDIMEYIGREPDLIMGTLHGPGYSGAIGFTKWYRQDYQIADDFHTYAIEWDHEGIRWFYDGELYQTLTRDVVGTRDWVFDHDFFILLNLAVGGQFPGPIGLDVEFPVNLYVDYVRVYQQSPDTPVES